MKSIQQVPQNERSSSLKIQLKLGPLGRSLILPIEEYDFRGTSPEVRLEIKPHLFFELD